MRAHVGLGWIEGPWETRDCPLISVITVVRRDRDGLLSTLRSVAESGLTNFEQIIIEGDAESCTSVADVRRTLGSQAALSWCVEPDSGIYAAMNKGMIAARGDWIWFLNAGDLVASESDGPPLEAFLVNVAPDAAWVVGSAKVVNASQGELRRKAGEDFSSGALRSGRYTPCHQAVLVRRLEAARVGSFDENLRLVGDYAMFLQLDARSEPAIYPGDIADYQDGGLSGRHLYRRRFEQALVRARLVQEAKHLKALEFARAMAFSLRHSLQTKAR